MTTIMTNLILAQCFLVMAVNGQDFFKDWSKQAAEKGKFQFGQVTMTQ